jgi:hypothetical protein
MTSLSLTGCSLWNPYVGSDIQRPAITDAAAPIEFAGGAAAGIDYANKWRSAYYDAVGDQVKMKNGIALVAIPAAATAVYLGISGNSTREVIAGLATGTAGLLGLGTYFESSDREKVYLAGSEAMGCVILASAPLLVPKDQFEQFGVDVDGRLREADKTRQDALQLLAGQREASLVGKIADTQEKLASVEEIEGRMRNAHLGEDPRVLAADGQLNDAQKLISDSSATFGTAEAYIARILSAGTEIVARVDNVRDKVGEQIIKTEPDIAAITQITGGLSSAAGRVATIPPPKPVKAKGAEAGTEKPNAIIPGVQALQDELAGALGRLRDSSGRLAAQTAVVRAFLAAQDDRAKAVGKIDQCGLANIAIGVTITPPDTEATLTPGQGYNVIISGGKRPYSASLVPANPDGVTLTRSGFDQDPVVATISTDKDKVKPGDTFSLAITDASGASSALINFTVGEATTPAQPADTGRPNIRNKPTISLTQFETELNKNTDKVKIVQFGAGMRGGDIDGRLGGTTRLNVKNYHNDTKHPDQRKKDADGNPIDDPTGEIDAGVFAEMSHNADAGWTDLVDQLNCATARNSFECVGISADDLKTQVQPALKANLTGIIDDNTREKIKVWQAKNGETQTGILTEDLPAKIIKNPLTE